MSPPSPQRIVLVVLAAAAVTGRPLPGQEAAGAQLWRLAAATVPLPPALSRGGPESLWNPAQTLAAWRAAMGLAVVRTPPEVGAGGFVSSAHARLGGLGSVAVVYGRMQIADLVRTTVSPEPEPGAIPYHTSAFRVGWARSFGVATAGVAAGYHTHQLAAAPRHRWTLDAGVRGQLGRLALGAATRLFSPNAPDVAQDVAAAVEVTVMRERVWGLARETTLALRYGIGWTPGLAADHLAGLGIDVAGALGVDLLVVREGGYGIAAWRAVAGLRLDVGRYRVTVARDHGVNDIGGAFRVGLEAGFGS